VAGLIVLGVVALLVLITLSRSIRIVPQARAGVVVKIRSAIRCVPQRVS